MRWLALSFLLAALGVACSSSSSAGSACVSEGGTCGSATEDAGGAEDAQSLPACSWPVLLEPPDSTIRLCVAARAYLACKGSKGDTELCSSSDLTQCPGPDAVPDETFSECEDQCDADVYAVECGGVGPAPSPPLPAGCRRTECPLPHLDCSGEPSNPT